MAAATMRLELGLDQANVLRDALAVFHKVLTDEMAEQARDSQGWLENGARVLAIEQIERQMGIHRNSK